MMIIIASFLTYAIPVAADESGSKLRLHYDMKALVEGPNGILIVPNVAGDAFHGIFREPQNGSHAANADVGFLTFSGGNASSRASYVEIPKGPGGKDILEGLHEVTVSAIINWTNDGENRWIFGFGTVLTPETNKYLFATPRHGIGGRNPVAAGISKQGWPNEALITGVNNSMLSQGVWHHVVVTMSEEKDLLTLYVNGEKVSEGSAKGIQLAEIIDPAASFSGFLAKSIFTNDPYYRGSIADFRVYEEAFTDARTLELYQEAQAIISGLKQLTLDDAAESLDITAMLHADDHDPQAITRNLTLPSVGKHGVAISWTSSRPEVLSHQGVVTRPDVDEEDAEVTLTAELSYQGLSRAVQFHVKVLKQYDPEQTAKLDAAALIIRNADKVKGNLRLPTVGKLGSQITWISSRPDIVKGSAEAEEASDPYELGRVTRPAEDTAVKLTARVQYDGAVEERNFDLLVVKAPEPLEYDAYFFAYFTGEYEGGEEISFAVAEHPLYWRALNNGKSVLQSTMGEMGVRDPFIIRSPEGDKFYLLATDLKMGESTNFDQAQITGSHSIMIWESDDLVNWSEQRMVEVAPKRGGNTWAPEAYYDEQTGEYVVFWASSMKIEDTYGKYPYGRPAGQYNVMYYATTRDFYEFSEPKVFIDEGFPTIDTTIIEHEGTLYRMTKSEVNYKVYLEKADSIYYDRDGIAENGFQFEPIAGTRNGNQGLIGHGGNNEGPTIFKDIREDRWYLFLDSWPYHVRWTTDLEDGSQLVNNLLPESAYALPPGPRHGTVIPITRAEYDALVARYGVPGPVEQEDPVVHYTFDPEDISGTVVRDVSGGGHHAELVGGVTIDEKDRVGETGGSAALDGSSGYVKLPDNLIRDLNLEKATFAVWVKLDRQQSGARIFDFASNTGRAVNRNTMYLSPRGDSGALEFAIVTPFTEKFANDTAPLGSNYKYMLRGNQLLPTDAWQHLAVTIDGFDAALYLNGEKIASSSVYNVEPRMLLETAMNYIGRSRSSAHPYLAGRIDDFRIYNRALSEEEIAALAEGAETPETPPSGAELLLHYDMKDVNGTVIPDQKGNFDGVWRNANNAEWIGTDEAGVISFTGGSTSSYIELPGGILNGLTSITVSALMNWSGKQPVEWLYALGRPTTETHYLYFTPRYNSDNTARFGLATNGWRNEVSARASFTLPANQWKLVTTVMDGANQTLWLYVDGVLVATGSTNGITLSQILAATGSSGYIGRSFYVADPYFGGMIADFRIYDGALTATEVAQLMQEADLKIQAMEGMFLQKAADRLTWANIAGSNEGPDQVLGDLVLPTSGAYGTTITWSSSHPDVISPSGKVTRPSFIAGDQVVTLTATFSDGKNQLAKTFTLTVLRLPDDELSVDLALEALVVHNIDDVRGHLTLPVTGLYGTSITWTSSDPDVITPTGEVSRPKHGQGDVTVTLTATARKNSVSKNKIFQALVRELPEPEPYEGYFFAYFTGEGRSDGEQIYFALSKGNDPLRWMELNDGKPVLTSTLGERGVRDPFIIRSPEGDKFYMIATDLRIYGNSNWDRAQRYGSRSIMVWESTDLIHWSDQRMVEVAPTEAGNTWAPEVIYDETTGEYVVFWASKLYDNPEHSGSSHQRILYAKTRDFHTFTEPQVYMDYGYSIIDTTMIRHNGKIYRFTKDERDNNASSPYGKMVFQEVGDSIFDPDFKLIKEGVGGMKWVEGPTIFKSNTEERWYLFVDEFGGRGYVPLTTTDLDSGEWTLAESYELPSSPRHGTVIPITKSEYDAIYKKYVAGEEPSDPTEPEDPQEPETPGEGLLLWYRFDESAGPVVVDSSGNGHHGTYERTPEFGTGVHGGSFRMTGGSNTSASPYVKIPNGLLKDMDDITIATYVKWYGGPNNQWLFGLGQDRNKYLFTSPMAGSSQKAAITLGSWQQEQGFSAGSTLKTHVWQHVAIVIDSKAKTARLYVDGIQVGYNGNVTIKPSDLYNASLDYSGYIGRSFYAEDPFFGGEVDDFRIYNRALSADEIASLAGNSTLITGVEVEGLKSSIIDPTNARVLLIMEKGTDLTSLAPTIHTALNASIEPESGVPQDFTDPVIYTVTDKSGYSRQWTIEARVMNSPVLPGLYADPHAAVFGNRFYIYPTTDGYPGWGSTQFKVFSSDDLVNWVDHGVILDLPRDLTWASERAWAPAAVEKNGKYYFYFSADTNIGVAVSTSPTGPFVDPLGRPLIPKGAYSGQMIDPMVFTDDDGQSYLYFGNGRGYVVKLKDDMITLDGTPVDITPSGFREAFFVFKRNGIYYFMWSVDDTGSENYRVAYGISDSPMGPIEVKGEILTKDLSLGIKGPGHHSVVKVPGKDEYYIVYHRFAIPNGDGTHRETTIDRLEFHEDGTIRKVVPTLESIRPVSVPAVPVTGLRLRQEGLDLKVGETGQLTAIITPMDATDRKLLWTSDMPEVATVDEYGQVKAISEGTATITVSTEDGAFTDTAIVTVEDWTSSGAELILHYDMKGADGHVVPDQAGSHDGEWVNADRAVHLAGDASGMLLFSGGSVDSYIKLPPGILDGLSSITVSALVNWDGARKANWVYALGTDNRKYLYYTPDYPSSAGGARLGMSTGSWQTEVSAKGPTLRANEWKLVTTVLDGESGKLILYVDGEEIASADVSYTLDQILDPAGPSGYIGRSMYAEDPYYGGAIADFRIYDGALNKQEIRELQEEAAARLEQLNLLILRHVADSLDALILGANPDLHEVTSNLNLPLKGMLGTGIAWTSSDESVITPGGVVTRPDPAAGDRAVKLVATLTNGGAVWTKEIQVTVKRLPDDAESVEAAREALIVHHIDDVRGHLHLPTKGLHGTSITWTSSDPDVITPTGEVSRPKHGQGDVTVTLTAKITKNGASAVKEFTALVRELPEPEPYAGYFFAYFTGEGRSDGEQIYFALSKGNDPLRWMELNDGKPVLTSTLGERGVRDPFIIRSPEGDKFYMIATDLRIYGNGDWDRAQRNGSRSIMVWESTDLIHWSDQRMVEVAPPEAGNTWAPEAFYDHEAGEYVVFWASKLYEDETHTGDTYLKMMISRTRDFHTFTEPEVYMDYGTHTLDLTMIEHEGKIIRILKENNIMHEVGDSIYDENFTAVNRAVEVGLLARGEGPTVFKSNTEEKWYLFIDEYGLRGYVPLETTDILSGDWSLSTDYELPSSPRHGTVIPITKSEYDLLYAKYVTGHIPVTGVSLDRTEATLEVGDTLQLAATVMPKYATNPQVVWSTSDDKVATVNESGLVRAVGAGTAVIIVTTVEGGYTAEARITVREQPPEYPEEPWSPPTPPLMPDEPVEIEIGENGLIILPPGPDGLPLPTIEIPMSIVLEALAQSPNQVLQLASDGVIITIDGQLIDNLDENSSLGVEIIPADTVELTILDIELDELPMVPVLYVNLTADGSPITAPPGSITVSVDLGAGIEGGSHQLVAFRLMPSGELLPLGFSLYDERSGQMHFQPDELAAYYLFISVLARFDDVSGWSQEAIEALAARGILLGKENGRFDPQGVITRAEFTAMLARLFELQPGSEALPFTDVPDDAWYRQELAAAYAAGIVTGLPDGTFRGNDPITRQEMAVLLFRAASLLSMLQQAGEGTTFADSSEIAAFARSAVSALSGAGIINGLPEGLFGPEQTATREQAAAMLWRLLKLVLG